MIIIDKCYERSKIMTYEIEVRKRYNEVAKQMKIEAPILKFSQSKFKNARAYDQKIEIDKGLAKLIFQDPELVETIIAHELTHYKNQDSYTLNKHKLEGKFIFSKKSKAKSVIVELRASIGGYTFDRMRSRKEILNIEKKFKLEKYIYNKKSSYKNGYPTSEQIANYASTNNELTRNIAEEILSDFCSVMDIKNIDEFIKDILKDIIK